MGSTEKGLFNYPWNEPPYEEQSYYMQSFRRGTMGQPGQTFKKVYQIVPTQEGRMFCCQGDIVRFANAYFPDKSWHEWFLSEEDKKQYFRKMQHIPAYASAEYAVVLARYKWTKYKWHGIYRDYGSIVMMLTGDSIGHVRKYYLKHPYYVYAPFHKKRRKLPKKVTQFTNAAKAKMIHKNNREEFVELLYRKLHNGEDVF